MTATGADSIGAGETTDERVDRTYRAYLAARQAADLEREALDSVRENYNMQVRRQNRAVDEYQRAAHAAEIGSWPAPSGHLCGWREDQFHWPSFYIDLYRKLGAEHDGDMPMDGYLDSAMAELLEGVS